MSADTIDRAQADYSRTIRGARELAREWQQIDTRMVGIWQSDTYKQEEK